jgi:DNA-directed RNA polymerase subunit RPC12/RpoP
MKAKIFLVIKEYLDGSGFYHISGNEKSLLAGNNSSKLDGSGKMNEKKDWIDKTFERVDATAKEMDKKVVCPNCGMELEERDVTWSLAMIMRPDGLHAVLEGYCGYCGNKVREIKRKALDKEELKE